MTALITHYFRTVDWMDDRFQQLVKCITPPARVRFDDGTIAYRYEEKGAAQAIIQKLALSISGLRAALHLLERGFVAEQAAICRIVNEAQEDVVFLVLASLDGSPDLLAQYLVAFFQEETATTEFKSGNHPKGRNTIGRKAILNFIARHEMSGDDPHTEVGAGLAIERTLSGFIHGASPHAMQSYDDRTGGFFTNGLPVQHSITLDHRHDMMNYIYRGLISLAYAAKAMAPAHLADELYDAFRNYEKTHLELLQ